VASLATAFVTIKPDTTGFGARLSQSVGTSASSAGTSAAKSFTSRFGAALKIGGVLAGAFAVTKGITFFKDTIAEATEATKVMGLTEAVIKSTGGTANLTADQVSKLSAAISEKVGVDDEAIQSGANMLLTFKNISDQAGKGNDIFTQATQTITDMSAAMGTDMKGSAIQLGKALNDPIAGISALSRVGVTFTDDQKEMITSLVEGGDTMAAQQIILKELKSEFGGAAAAMATPAEKAQVAWGNFKEDIGMKLLPVIEDLSNWFRKEGLPALEDFGRWIGQKLGPVLEDLGKWFRKDVVPALEDFGIALGEDVWPVIQDAAPALKRFGEIAKDAAVFLADLPGPIKQFAGILAGLALVRSTSMFQNLAGAVGKAVTSFKAMPPGGKISGSFSGLKNMLTGANGVTVLVGLAATAVFRFWQEQKEAQAHVADLTESLNQQSGAYTKLTAEMVYARLMEEGAFEAADKLGISHADVTQAALGNEAAQRRVNGALRVANKTIEENTANLRGNWRQSDENAVAVDSLTRIVGEEENAVKDSVEAWRDKKAALKVANQEVKVGTGRAKDLNDEYGNIPGMAGRAGEAVDGLSKTVREVPNPKFDVGPAMDDVQRLEQDIRARLKDIPNEDIGIELNTTAARAMGVALIGAAKGGAIYGPGTGTSDSIPARLSAGEHVWTAEEVKRGGGHRVMEGLRKLAKQGMLTKVGDVGRPGYAEGGAVVNPRVTARGVADMIADARAYTSAVGDVLSEALSAKLNTIFTRMGTATSVAGLGSSGSLTPAEVVRGQDFARSKFGMPYQWGGIGNPSYDCSGFVGSTLLAAKGLNPAQRLGTTESMPWNGFTRGSGSFTIFNKPDGAGGASGAHMAGAIGGLGIESGGSGVGGLTSSVGFFPDQWKFDRGGILRSGGTAVNRSGRPERVLSPQSTRDFERLVDVLSRKGGGGVQRFVLDAGGGRTLTGWIQDEIDGQASLDSRLARLR